MKKSTLLVLLVSFLLVHPVVSNAQKSSAEDPFLWLEEIESEKSLNWVKEQNKNSEKILVSNPLFENLQKNTLKFIMIKTK